ncbi:hypothetical protein [Nocardia sp. NPDC050793]
MADAFLCAGNWYTGRIPGPCAGKRAARDAANPARPKAERGSRR